MSNSEDIYEKILQEVLKPGKSKLKDAYLVVEKAYSLYKFDELWLSFNGGKDSAVVLYIIKTFLYKNQKHNEHIEGMYFVEHNPFEEIDLYINEQIQSQKINFHTLQRDFKLVRELQNQYPIKGIFMGSRNTDPYCSHLSEFTPSDINKGYPPFMRINPIIDWQFNEIWSFIKVQFKSIYDLILINYDYEEFNIPYCRLYDQGYTYLGDKDNSYQNPTLQIEGSYRPAWECEDIYENVSRNLQKQEEDSKEIVLVFLINIQKQNFSILQKKINQIQNNFLEQKYMIVESSILNVNRQTLLIEHQCLTKVYYENQKDIEKFQDYQNVEFIQLK